MRDDLKGRCDDQEAEVLELQEKLNDVTELAQNARKYKDEVDELRTEAANMVGNKQTHTLK